MFVVVKTHNFDPETEATAFEDEKEAKAYLQWLWENYYDEEIANDSYLVERECYHEEDFAKIQWEDGCQTWFKLIETVPVRADFSFERRLGAQK